MRQNNRDKTHFLIFGGKKNGKYFYEAEYIPNTLEIKWIDLTEKLTRSIDHNDIFFKDDDERDAFEFGFKPKAILCGKNKEYIHIFSNF